VFLPFSCKKKAGIRQTKGFKAGSRGRGPEELGEKKGRGVTTSLTESTVIASATRLAAACGKGSFAKRRGESGRSEPGPSSRTERTRACSPLSERAAQQRRTHRK